MRYGEQIFEVNVPLDGVDLEAPEAMAEVVARFHKRHEELYTYAAPDQEVVLVNARLAVVGELPGPAARSPRCPPRAPAAPRQRRRVYLDGWREVPVYDLDGGGAGPGDDGPRHRRGGDDHRAPPGGRAGDGDAPRLARHPAVSVASWDAPPRGRPP